MNAQEEINRLQAKIDDGSMQPDEPLFVLRARDALAPIVVAHWAALAQECGCPAAVYKEALEQALAMGQWPLVQMPGQPATRTDRPDGMDWRDMFREEYDQEDETDALGEDQ